ncbi:MAG: hypothetical protein LKK33_08870 [Prevotella sp.]|jgi:hypothetical protein|nr:hypothetical protein [Prevotella sp.]MCI1686387.1 hypothetical protein [Prevotella sp.]MCI2138395.1 hypothetical protein [Prevotella sp.]MCI2151308.1 hypothetical protein [Prevotella sp.]
MILPMPSYSKLEYIFMQYQKDATGLCNSMQVKKEEIVDVIAACYYLEKQKSLCLSDLKKNKGESKLAIFEKTNILNCFHAFNTKPSDFVNLEIQMNPYIRFISSPYLFFTEDGDRLKCLKYDCEYSIIPKIIAIGELYVIEYPLIGPYRFLQALTHFSGKFRLTDLIRGRTEKENRMIQLRIKKMLLNQMLIISG